MPSMRDYWSTIPIFSHPIFPQIMTSARYLELARYLHTFNKKAVPDGNTDRLILVRPVMEYIQSLCRQLYVPKQNLSLDEGIMPYKGRLTIKAYNPMKPDKYGVKFYFCVKLRVAMCITFLCIVASVSLSMKLFSLCWGV